VMCRLGEGVVVGMAATSAASDADDTRPCDVNFLGLFGAAAGLWVVLSKILPASNVSHHKTRRTRCGCSSTAIQSVVSVRRSVYLQARVVTSGNGL
jgi:hypothetical protein